MANKYTVIKGKTPTLIKIGSITYSSDSCSTVFKNNLPFAFFMANNHKSDAQKVCDLLNETSRSQGKYPTK